MAGKVSFLRMLELYALYARMDLDFLIRDAKYSLLVVAAEALTSVSSVTGVFLLAWRFDGVGGMSRWDVLFMLGYVTCVTGLFSMFFAANNGHISRRIGRGQLDHMLIQPVPLPVQLATEGFAPFTGSQALLCGIGIIVWALHGMGRTPGVLWVLGLIGYLVTSIAIILGLSYLFSSLAFRWQVAFEEISMVVIDDLTGVLSNYPLSGMPMPVQWALITVVPAGLLGWFPACALLDEAPLNASVLYPLFVAVILWALAALAFRKGFEYYVKTGSNRYTAGAHRR